jgi:hypothetical protein
MFFRLFSFKLLKPENLQHEIVESKEQNAEAKWLKAGCDGFLLVFKKEAKKIKNILVSAHFLRWDQQIERRGPKSK